MDSRRLPEGQGRRALSIVSGEAISVGMRLNQICALFFGGVLACGALRAAENKYDALAKTLAPFVNLFAKKSANPNRAVSMRVRIEEMTDLPRDLAGARAELALEHPDKLRLHAPVLGETLTICRNGQELWVHPGSKAALLLEVATASTPLPKPDPKFRLAPFRLPVPEKQLVFFPALFQVRDGGFEDVGGESCRVLDLQLMPELGRALGVAEWMAWLWIRPNHLPARLELGRNDWRIVVRFDEVKFSPALPSETWRPSAEEAADVLNVSPAQYQQLLKAIGEGKSR